MRDFLEDLWAMSWRDRLLTLVLVIGLSPLSVPFVLCSIVGFRWNLWNYLHGSTDEAWARCARLWSESRVVCGSAVGASLGTPFVYSLAEHFVRYHPDARDFLLRQLHHSDPYLVAYAFKCLIRFSPLSIDDIPSDVLNRGEELNALLGGCIAERIRVGQYIRDYFPTKPIEEQSASELDRTSPQR